MEPKISVIIPCYNYGRYLAEAIDSVLDQTFKDFEIIIVDDGSNDKFTIDLLNKLNDLYPDIRLIRKENGGLASARNAGIRVARGKFFVPLDADDKLEPEFLEKCLGVLENNPTIAFVYTYTKQFGDTNEIIARREYNFLNLLKVNYIVATCLFRKIAWENIGGYDEIMRNWYEDWEFIIRLGENGYYGYLVRQPLFSYRKHGKTMITEAIEKHNEVYLYIKKKHSELFSAQNMAKLDKEWNRLNFDGAASYFIYKIHSIKYKLEAAGVLNSESWRKKPIKTLIKILPVGLKRKINKLFGHQIFDISYFGKE